MQPPSVTHLLSTLHFHPTALTDLVESQRELTSAMQILSHAIGGEMSSKLMYEGAIEAAMYAAKKISAERAAAQDREDSWQRTTEDMCCSPSVAAQDREDHGVDG